jgi:hypothetical protein
VRKVVVYYCTGRTWYKPVRGGGGYHDSGGHVLRARDSTSTTIRGLRGLVRVRVRADHCDRGTTLDAVVCYLPQHLLQT